MLLKKESFSVLKKITPELVFFSLNLLRVQLKQNPFINNSHLIVRRKWCYKISFLLRSQQMFYKDYRRLSLFRFNKEKKFNYFVRSQVIEYIFIFLLKPYFNSLSLSSYNLSEYV